MSVIDSWGTIGVSRILKNETEFIGRINSEYIVTVVLGMTVWPLLLLEQEYSWAPGDRVEPSGYLTTLQNSPSTLLNAAGENTHLTSRSQYVCSCSQLWVGVGHAGNGVALSVPELYRGGGDQNAKLRGLSPLGNYTDRATVACRRRWCQFLRIEGATWLTWRIPTVVRTGAATLSSKCLLKCTHEAEWTPFQTHYLGNLVVPGIEPRPLDL
jgi:hypothetical protein